MLKRRVDKKVAIIEIDKSDTRNAISLSLANQIKEALEELDYDKKVNVIILKGNEHGFSSGSDLKELSQFNLEQIAKAEREKATIAREINFLSTPVIASVDGFALGGGLIYAISCDVVFTSKSAKWHLPEVKLGWNPGWGVKALIERVGVVNARHICWGVDVLDGVEAHRIRLADFLAQNDAYSASLEYAKKLSSLPFHAVSATKKLCAPIAGENSQVLDLVANDLFAKSSSHRVAKASYKRFGINI